MTKMKSIKIVLVILALTGVLFSSSCTSTDEPDSTTTTDLTNSVVVCPGETPNSTVYNAAEFDQLLAGSTLDFHLVPYQSFVNVGDFQKLTVQRDSNGVYQYHIYHFSDVEIFANLMELPQKEEMPMLMDIQLGEDLRTAQRHIDESLPNDVQLATGYYAVGNSYYYYRAGKVKYVIWSVEDQVYYFWLATADPVFLSSATAEQSINRLIASMS